MFLPERRIISERRGDGEGEKGDARATWVFPSTALMPGTGSRARKNYRIDSMIVRTRHVTCSIPHSNFEEYEQSLEGML